MATEKPASTSPFEIITSDAALPHGEKPLVTLRSGQTDGKTYFIKINQPTGRAVMIAVHL